MMVDFESIEFIARLKRLDEVAIRQLIEYYQPLFQPLVASVVGSLADDVMQDVWISIAKSVQQFQHKSSFKTWIYRIVMNKMKSYLRKKEVAINAEPIDEGHLFKSDGHWQQPSRDWHLSSPEEMLESYQLCQEVSDAIEKMPVMQRVILLMHDFDGMKMQSICNILELNASNGRVLLHRARCAIYQAIEEM